MRRLIALLAGLVWLLCLVLVGPTSTATTFTSACQQAITSHSQARCDRVHVLGHRAVEGPSTGTNENTISALSRDHVLGVGCETDTWRLAADDGTPSGGPSVMFHDTTIGRVVSAATITEAGLTPDTAIADVTLAQFRLLRTQGGQPLATLYQWIRHLGGWHVPCMIEIKQRPLDPAQTARWVHQYAAPATFYGNPQDPTGSAPCSMRHVLAMRDVGMTVGLKYRYDCPISVAQIAADGYAYFTYPHPTASVVREAHLRGLTIGDGGRNATTWADLVNTGVDFIIAPHPATLKRWLG